MEEGDSEGHAPADLHDVVLAGSPVGGGECSADHFRVSDFSVCHLLGRRHFGVLVWRMLLSFVHFFEIGYRKSRNYVHFRTKT